MESDTNATGSGQEGQQEVVQGVVDASTGTVLTQEVNHLQPQPLISSVLAAAPGEGEGSGLAPTPEAITTTVSTPLAIPETATAASYSSIVSPLVAMSLSDGVISAAGGAGGGGEGGDMAGAAQRPNQAKVALAAVAPVPTSLAIHDTARLNTAMLSSIQPIAPLAPLSGSTSAIIGPRHSITSNGTSHYQPLLSSPPKSSHRKTGLKKTYFSRTHFSSPFVPREKGSEDMTRLVVRILDGKDLLASDVQTGKSDPLCFAWCCSNQVRVHIMCVIFILARLCSHPVLCCCCTTRNLTYG